MEFSLTKTKTKIGIKLPYDPAIPQLGVYPEKNHNPKEMYPSVHCSTNYNHQNMKAT